MSTSGSKVLSKMLDRLLAGLMSGPNMNCRPYKSRQRIDLSQVARLADVSPEDVLRDLLGSDRCARAAARVKMPRKLARSPMVTEEHAEEEPKSPGEKAWLEQLALLAKLRVIADDARTYENDTGVHALSIGFPLLSLPPGSFGGGGARPGTKRILAPIAFIPVTLSMKGGATPTAEIACHSEGADRVRANPALLSWIEQQTGKPVGADLFEDEAGTDPWREIIALVMHVAAALGVEIPQIFRESSLTGDGAPVATTESGTVATTVENTVESITDAADANPSVSAIMEPANEEPVGEAVLVTPPPGEIPKSFKLQPAPRGDEQDEHPAIIVTAVLGLFPTAHQGLVRDTRAMIAESSTGNSFTGPILSFLTTGIDFDAVAPQPVSTAAPTTGQLRPQASERLAADADPCQARAVALARQSSTLVVHGPPGTGKSQTITNMIADHLSRGQRVLLVCEKRTALDVVADRLEHMGLRNFCAIVHDPQRDQRDLYRSIRQQLDDLPDVKTHPRAESSLVKVDAELQQLHDELTGFHRALMDPGATGGPSFHELMGQWMTNQPDPMVRLDDAATAGISADDLEENRAAMTDLFRWARSVNFSNNPWSDCAGAELSDFLARPMADVRTRMERLVAAAGRADTAADENVPPFNDEVALADQAIARTKLADQLEKLLPAAREFRMIDLNGKTVVDCREMLEENKKAGILVTIMMSTSVDPELAALPLPSLTQIIQQSGDLQIYMLAMSRWTGFFHFRQKAAARKVLMAYGLTLSPANAERVSKHLAGLRPRYLLTVRREQCLGTITENGHASLATDKQLASYYATFSAWLELVLTLFESPAIHGLLEVATKRLMTDEGSALFVEGLKKSPPRAEAIAGLVEAFAECALFDSKWLANIGAELRRGKLADETAAFLQSRLDSLEGVLRVRTGRAAMPDKLRPVVDLMLSQVVEPDAAMAAIQGSVLTNEIRARLRSDPRLQVIDAHHIESAFDRFRQLDGQKKTLVRDFIAHQWITKQQQRLLASTGTRLNALGAALRQRLLMRGEHAIRLRQVIARGENIEDGDPLFDLCPVWMASPETVAQVFPRNAMFDVVVFDEASQCRLEEALPVLMRGQRVVIAGDPNQLPPTRFFESGLVQSDEDEPETEQELFEAHQGEIEDLLAAALNLAIQQCYLDVHYRSRNSDLIEFSNRNFYASRLQAIPGHPANRPKFSPLTLYRVEGVYNKRRNDAEADQVVTIVRDLLKRATPPSIGIACLNLPQRDLIVEKLDALAAVDADFATRLAAARTRKGTGSFEGLFVKNLENVQGDERDDIIISTTYGPDANGKFYRRFGPVGMAGGGRRLNVLVTRARNQVHLVTSIPVDAYRTLAPVPDGQSATGAWLLFAYLKYAEDLVAAYQPAQIPAIPENSAPATSQPVMVNVLPCRSPSLFSERLAAFLAGTNRLGSDVHWGNDGFCVDLAIRDPVRATEVTIGVLCDGCRYTAADDPVEWDIFRTGVLEKQGWKLLRVWTPHFFRDDQRILKVITTAAAQFSAVVAGN